MKSHIKQRPIVAYLDSVRARLASLRQLQSETQEELDALLPSVLDRAFRGDLKRKMLKRKYELIKIIVNRVD